MAQVPVDTWLLICSHFFHSPHHVFRLMVASRGVWEALRKHPVWWDTFYQRVFLYHSVLSQSAYCKQLHHFTDHVDKKLVLKLLFVRVCETCGARQGHTLIRPLMARLCSLCLQPRLVSNRVLLRRYGLHFSDFLIPYHEGGGVLIAHRQHLKKNLHGNSSLLWLTCDPLDFETRKFEHALGFKHELLFFSVRDLERILGLRLAQEEQRHAERLWALDRLSSQFQMVNARRAMLHEQISVHDILVNDRWMRVQKSLRSRAHPGAMGMMGGPYMLGRCVFGFRSVPRLRVGHTHADLARLNAIVNEATLL